VRGPQRLARASHHGAYLAAEARARAAAVAAVGQGRGRPLGAWGAVCLGPGRLAVGRLGCGQPTVLGLKLCIA